MKKRSVIIVAIILMSIGFASISTTLIINGNAKVSENNEDFLVTFTAASIDGKDVYSSVADDTKKIINFTTPELSKVGDNTVLTYEVTNNSSNYDAEVRVTCVPKDGTTAKYTSIKNKFENDASVVKAKESINGTLTITLDKTSTEEVSEEYTCKLEFNAVERTEIGVNKNYKENILNGADPVISGDLTPVIIADDGTVTYADIKNEWYSYENKVWANAVILEDNVSYKVGDTIQESAIQSYFVWIPRYRYKLFNTDNTNLTTVPNADYIDSKAQEIEVEFENKDTSLSNGITNGSWLTHPAFTSFDTNGFWVGKFETGYKGATSVETAQINSNDSSKIIIKPDVYSWRNINVKNVFEASYSYNRNLDSHMMKNTEWGAVAYLSHSKYGIDKEININNNSSYKTGYSSLTTLDQSSYPGIYGVGESYNKPYNTEVGYLASTTGNISGIYDMSGGASEYIAGYMDGQMGESELTTINYDTKYFDVYSSSSTMTSYQNRILGDATGESGPFYCYSEKDGNLYYHNGWYSDFSYFVESLHPWFYRSGTYDNGVLTGQFYFQRFSGQANSTLGFRVVITPKDL